MTALEKQSQPKGPPQEPVDVARGNPFACGPLVHSHVRACAHARTHTHTHTHSHSQDIKYAGGHEIMMNIDGMKLANLNGTLFFLCSRTTTDSVALDTCACTHTIIDLHTQSRN